VFKEGVAEDFANKERIARLLRFASTKSEGAGQTVALDDYIGRMKAEQESIYFLTADGYAAARGSPQLEALKAHDIEVLLMYDRIDDWMSTYLTEYSGKKLRNVAKGDLDLGKLAGADGEKRKEAEKAAEGVVGKLKELLGERVRDVRVSSRLTDSPSCLVLDEHDMAWPCSACSSRPDTTSRPANPCSRSIQATRSSGAWKSKPTRRARATWASCCSSRRNCSRAPSSKIRRPTCGASTHCSWEPCRPDYTVALPADRSGRHRGVTWTQRRAN